MFTGVIEAIGRVERIGPAAGDNSGAAQRIELRAGELLDDVALGGSVAVNGACLTLAQRRGPIGCFDVIPETWRRTTLGRLRVGDSVNLERALRVGDRLDGHFVQGHVDAVAPVDALDRAGDEWRLWLQTPPTIAPYLVAKGSIAVAGVSLTLADVQPARFCVALIPTTLRDTTLGALRTGDEVNLETDMLARLIVARLDALAAPTSQPPQPNGLSWERLRDAGFVS